MIQFFPQPPSTPVTENKGFFSIADMKRSRTFQTATEIDY